eukprot:6853694-Prymnesium_polylepis.2
MRDPELMWRRPAARMLLGGGCVRSPPHTPDPHGTRSPPHTCESHAIASPRRSQARSMRA